MFFFVRVEIQVCFCLFSSLLFFGFLSTHTACVCMFLREPPHVFVFCYRSRMTDRQTQRMRMGDRRVAGSTLPKFCFGFCVRRCGAKKSQIQKRRVLVERETTRSFFLLCRWRERTFFFPCRGERGKNRNTFLFVGKHTYPSFFFFGRRRYARAFCFSFWRSGRHGCLLYFSFVTAVRGGFRFLHPGCVLVTHTSGGNARMLLTDQHESSSPPCGFFLTFFLFGRKKTTRRDTHTHTHHGEKKKTFLCFFPTAGVCVCCGVGVVSSSSSPSPTLCFLKYRQYPRIQK